MNRAYAGVVYRKWTISVFALLALSGGGLAFAAKAKPHYAALGKARTVSYSAQSDPAGARPGETRLIVRPLVVDGTIKGWTTGETHEVTLHTFTVRSALRLNDALPADKHEHWVWQRGPWLLVDKRGKVKDLRLPDFAPAVSDIVWFRDYAAYCGLSASGKSLYAVVARIGVRRAVVSKKLGKWTAAAHPAPTCGPAVWQRDPPRVSFSPTEGDPISFDIVGSESVPVKTGLSLKPRGSKLNPWKLSTNC
jgi:hypothetical protein